MWNRDAQPVALLVVKCTFEADARQQTFPAEKQASLCLADEYYGEPGQSSIRTGNDLALFKPAVDVIITGSFYGPPNSVVQRLDAGLMIGSAIRRLRVTGDRMWVGGIFDYQTSDPQPFERVSASYELAYGGTGLKSAEMRNPVGRGYHERDAEVEGSLLPNIEWADAQLQHWRERPNRRVWIRGAVMASAFAVRWHLR